MDFRTLNYVIAIAEHGTISRAAEALHIAQPSLSKFLQNLEKSLGVVLFEYVNRRMRLTDAGEQYVQMAYHIRSLGNQLQNSMNDRARLRTGFLSIGSTPARSKYVMINTLPEFKRLYPGFRLSISEKPFNELEHDLRNGAVDLALYTVKTYQEEFVYDHICTEEIVLAMSPENPHAGEGEKKNGLKRPWIDIRRLRDQVFLMPPEDWRSARVCRKLLNENNMESEIIQMGSAEAAVAVVSKGLGVCLCPSMMEICFEGDNKPIYFSVGEPIAEVEFVVVHRKTLPLTQAIKDYIRIVRSVFGDR